jgi:hypothetical protein
MSRQTSWRNAGKAWRVHIEQTPGFGRFAPRAWGPQHYRVGNGPTEVIEPLKGDCVDGYHPNEPFQGSTWEMIGRWLGIVAN